MYVYVPGVEKLMEPEAPWLSNGVFQLPSVAAASCANAPELVHVTVWPAAMVVLAGV